MNVKYWCLDVDKLVLAKSTDDIIASIKPSRHGKAFLHRSQSSVMLRCLGSTEIQPAPVVNRILEKGESFGDTLDFDMEEQQDTESSDNEEKRAKSIQRLRGILKSLQ